MRLAAAIVGGLLGLVLVRFMFLGPFEILGWALLWEYVGRVRIPSLEMVQASMLIKSGIGFGVGFLLGRALAGGRQPQQTLAAAQPDDWEPRGFGADLWEEAKRSSNARNGRWECPSCNALNIIDTDTCDCGFKQEGD